MEWGREGRKEKKKGKKERWIKVFNLTQAKSKNNKINELHSFDVKLGGEI